MADRGQAGVQVERAEVEGGIGAQSDEELKDVIDRLAQSPGGQRDSAIAHQGQRLETRLIPLGDGEVVRRSFQRPAPPPAAAVAIQRRAKDVVGTGVARAEVCAQHQPTREAQRLRVPLQLGEISVIEFGEDLFVEPLQGA